MKRQRIGNKLLLLFCMLAIATSLIPSKIVANATETDKKEGTCQKNTIEGATYANRIFYLNSCTDTVAEFLEWKQGNPAYKIEISVTDSKLTFADLEEGTYAKSTADDVLSVKYYKWYWDATDPSTGRWRNDAATVSYTLTLKKDKKEEKHFQGTIEAKFGKILKSGVFTGTKFTDGQFDFTVGEVYTAPESESATIPKSNTNNSKSSTNNANTNKGNTNSTNNNSTQKQTSSGICSHCNGTGVCYDCGAGECDECFGQQMEYCTKCIAGRCDRCGGDGQIERYANGNIKYTTCTSCNGSGVCKKCGGTKYIECSKCHGSGQCRSCNGTTICKYCKGKG